jgi:hypothetical protein
VRRRRRVALPLPHTRLAFAFLPHALRMMGAPASARANACVCSPGTQQARSTNVGGDVDGGARWRRRGTWIGGSKCKRQGPGATQHSTAVPGDALLLCTRGPPQARFRTFLPGLNGTVQEKVGN